MVYPRNRDQARKWNKFTKQDHFWKIRDWPFRMQALAMMKHLKNKGRLNLLYFWLANGLPPHIAEDWLLSNGTYDGHAGRHVRWLCRNWKKYAYGYWNMRLKMYVNRRPYNRRS